MESIAYLTTQIERMSRDQRSLVERVAAMPADTQPTKMEEERLAQLYLWLHMESGSIAHRRFTSDLGIKGRRRRR